jgi:hypothetical protein
VLIIANPCVILSVLWYSRVSDSSRWRGAYGIIPRQHASLEQPILAERSRARHVPGSTTKCAIRCLMPFGGEDERRVLPVHWCSRELKAAKGPPARTEELAVMWAVP